jgi:hypothetical protein
MKVICIDAGMSLKCINSLRISTKLIEHKVYNVLETRKWSNGKYYYILKELEPDLAYECNLFIPLSEIDERELVNSK